MLCNNLYIPLWQSITFYRYSIIITSYGFGFFCILPKIQSEVSYFWSIVTYTPLFWDNVFGIVKTVFPMVSRSFGCTCQMGPVCQDPVGRMYSFQNVIGSRVPQLHTFWRIPLNLFNSRARIVFGVIFCWNCTEWFVICISGYQY